MKGLLRNDWYQTIKYLKMFFLMIVIFIGVSLAQPDNTFFLMYPFILPTMAPVSLMGYYDNSKFYIYADTTPVSRAKYVSSKYVYSLICMMFVFLLSWLAQTCRYGLSPELLGTLSMFSALGLLGPGITLPLLFHFGMQKGRIAYYFCVGAFFALAFILQDTMLYFSRLPAGVLALICAAAFVLSWLLSIWLYQRREL